MRLHPDDPPPFECLPGAANSPFVLTCEHASCAVPHRLGSLGLKREQLEDHIGWDPGAAALARSLARALDAPLILSGYSRLVVDCNRPLQSPDLIARQSSSVVVPGNADLSDHERAARIDSLFRPYHDAIDQLLDRRDEQPTWLLAIHSFTPVWRGVHRPWHVGVAAGVDRRLANPLVAGLRQLPGLTVGDNEPYRIEAHEDYTIPVHAEARGLPGALLEVRNDGLRSPRQVADWTTKLSSVLQAIAVQRGKITV